MVSPKSRLNPSYFLYLFSVMSLILRIAYEGSHPIFSDRVQELERDRDECILRANLWRDYQLACAETMYHLEREQVEQEYLAEKNGLKEKMLQQIDERRKRLKEDRDALSIDNDASMDNGSRNANGAAVRKLRRRVQEPAPDTTRTSKRRQQQGPPVQLALKENEILEDLFILSKLDSANPRKMARARKMNRGY